MVPAGGGGGGTPDAGGGGGGGTGIVATEAGYTQKVLPLVQTKTCIKQGCHNGNGTTPPNFTSFQTISAGNGADPTRYVKGPGAANVLVTHVAQGGPHNGTTWFTEAEIVTVANWIDNR